MSAPDKYAVFGNPIEHSKSPQIHRLFAKQTGENIVYEKQLVELGDFERAAKSFFESGGKGLNITAPFKGEAFKFADVLSKRAELSGAVNTLAKMPSGEILGENTDGIGLVWDLKTRLGVNIAESRVLVVGAGGATRGVLYPLLQENPAAIVVANRTCSKAKSLAKLFDAYGAITGIGLDSVVNEKCFDLVINATSAGLSGGLVTLSTGIFEGVNFVYDMSYENELTPFLVFAKNNGVEKLSDGRGMLVGQASESFRIWRNRQPDAESIFLNAEVFSRA